MVRVHQESIGLAKRVQLYKHMSKCSHIQEWSKTGTMSAHVKQSIKSIEEEAAPTSRSVSI
jgi:hypothetical protein